MIEIVRVFFLLGAVSMAAGLIGVPLCLSEQRRSRALKFGGVGLAGLILLITCTCVLPDSEQDGTTSAALRGMKQEPMPPGVGPPVEVPAEPGRNYLPIWKTNAPQPT